MEKSNKTTNNIVNIVLIFVILFAIYYIYKKYTSPSALSQEQQLSYDKCVDYYDKNKRKCLDKDKKQVKCCGNGVVWEQLPNGVIVSHIDLIKHRGADDILSNNAACNVYVYENDVTCYDDNKNPIACCTTEKYWQFPGKPMIIKGAIDQHRGG